MERIALRLIAFAAAAVAVGALLWPIPDETTGMWAVTVGSEATSLVAVGAEPRITPMQVLARGLPDPVVVEGIEIEHPIRRDVQERLIVTGTAAMIALGAWVLLRRPDPHPGT